MSSASAKNNRKRHRLHKAQGGSCYYCPDTIGILIEQRGNPVLEHYIPQSAGGTRVVLACQSCDKMKGMIHGPEFEEILRAHTVEGDNQNQIRQKVSAVCKKRNIELQSKHEPGTAGMIRTRQRAAALATRMGVSVTKYPPQPFSTIGESGRGPVVEQWRGATYMNAQSSLPGNSGRDAFVEEWKRGKPSTGDRHYQGWTGKHPA